MRCLLRGSLCAVQIRCFHLVGWCVLLQWNYGGGSYIAVAFSMRCDFMGWKRLLATAAKFVSASVALRSGSVHTYVPIRSDVLCRGDKLRDLRR